MAVISKEVRTAVDQWCRSGIPGQKQNNTDTENKLVVGRVWEVGEIGETDQEVQTISYIINESQGCNVQHKEYSQLYYNFVWWVMYKNIESLYCTPET